MGVIRHVLQDHPGHFVVVVVVDRAEDRRELRSQHLCVEGLRVQDPRVRSSSSSPSHIAVDMFKKMLPTCKNVRTCSSKELLLSS